MIKKKKKNKKKKLRKKASKQRQNISKQTKKIPHKLSLFSDSPPKKIKPDQIMQRDLKVPYVALQSPLSIALSLTLYDLCFECRRPRNFCHLSRSPEKTPINPPAENPQSPPMLCQPLHEASNTTTTSRVKPVSVFSFFAIFLTEIE